MNIKNEGFIKIFEPSFCFIFRIFVVFTFAWIQSGVPYGASFFYWRKEIVQVDLFNTLNMVAKSKENFLETLQKNLYPHKNDKMFSSVATLRRFCATWVKKSFLAFRRIDGHASHWRTHGCARGNCASPLDLYWRSKHAQLRARPFDARQSIPLIQKMLLNYLIANVAEKLDNMAFCWKTWK